MNWYWYFLIAMGFVIGVSALASFALNIDKFVAPLCDRYWDWRISRSTRKWEENHRG